MLSVLKSSKCFKNLPMLYTESDSVFCSRCCQETPKVLILESMSGPISCLLWLQRTNQPWVCAPCGRAAPALLQYLPTSVSLSRGRRQGWHWRLLSASMHEYVQIFGSCTLETQKRTVILFPFSLFSGQTWKREVCYVHMIIRISVCAACHTLSLSHIIFFLVT